MADITISREAAEKLYDLYNNIVVADAHYQRCQSDNFRLHVQAVYKNTGVSGAFEDLKQKLEEHGAPDKVLKARRSVLTGE